MGYQDFISEHEATAITGMSKTTLSRFAEAGYLQLETDSDGLRMFSKGELAGLFGLKEFSGREKTKEKDAPKRETLQPTAVPEPASFDVAPKAELLAKAEVVEPTLAQQIERVIVHSTPAPETPEPAVAPAASRDHSAHLELEVQRLKNLMQLQERILDLKDQQLHDMQQQRDWLQARVEKLEDKADRDQILLLTETQTIRSLVNVAQQQRRRSPMRLALEWLGVTAPEEESKNGAGAIDIATGMQKVREA